MRQAYAFDLRTLCPISHDRREAGGRKPSHWVTYHNPSPFAPQGALPAMTLCRQLPRHRILLLPLVGVVLTTAASVPTATAAEKAARDDIQVTRLLPAGPGNPRNSEGDFVKLRDGRVLFIYSHFTDGSRDFASAHLAGRYSEDGGRTWTDEDVLVLPNEGDMNVMSVSLLRLQDGRIALFYLRKNGLADCRPVMRVSTDEARTWSDPIDIIADEDADYYVLNNDRVVQLETGRLVAPLALHTRKNETNDWRGVLLSYYSDDAGKTWRRGKTAPVATTAGGRRAFTQEPGVVELRDGRLMLFTRTNSGCQYVAYSSDGAETWSKPEPSTMLSPCSPATIERIPDTDTLLLVWNNHESITPNLRGKRTPLSIAISTDEAKTWQNAKNLADNPHGWYCYTAMHLEGDHVLLSYCAGDRREGNGLHETHVTRVPLEFIGK